MFQTQKALLSNFNPHDHFILKHWQGAPLGLSLKNQLCCHHFQETLLLYLEILTWI